MTIDRNGLEVLSTRECLRLLESANLGRIAITSGALPVILPINYRVDGDRILFRTSPGTKLDAATHNAVVAFEVDHVDPVYHSGWSVMVTGIATDVEEGSADDLWTIPRWAPGPEERLVAISINQISGRRVEPGGYVSPTWELHDSA
jgi:hypothetical protein